MSAHEAARDRAAVVDLEKRLVIDDEPHRLTKRGHAQLSLAVRARILELGHEARGGFKGRHDRRHRLVSRGVEPVRHLTRAHASEASTRSYVGHTRAVLSLVERLKIVPQVGAVAWIGVRPSRGEAMTVLDQVEVIADRALVGDRYKA